MKGKGSKWKKTNLIWPSRAEKSRGLAGLGERIYVPISHSVFTRPGHPLNATTPCEAQPRQNSRQNILSAHAQGCRRRPRSTPCSRHTLTIRSRCTNYRPRATAVSSRTRTSNMRKFAPCFHRSMTFNRPCAMRRT